MNRFKKALDAIKKDSNIVKDAVKEFYDKELMEINKEGLELKSEYVGSYLVYYSLRVEKVKNKHGEDSNRTFAYIHSIVSPVSHKPIKTEEALNEVRQKLGLGSKIFQDQT